MAKKKKWKGGGFLALPFDLLKPGSPFWGLTSDERTLFMLALSRADFKLNNGNKGGIHGPRTMPYSVVKKLTGWHSRKTKKAFDGLIAKDFLVPKVQTGVCIRPATLYFIGSAHTWVSRPTSTHGRELTSTLGRGKPDNESNSRPPVDTPKKPQISFTHKQVTERLGCQANNLIPTSRGGRDSRSTIVLLGKGPLRILPGKPAP